MMRSRGYVRKDTPGYGVKRTRGYFRERGMGKIYPGSVSAKVPLDGVALRERRKSGLYPDGDFRVAGCTPWVALKPQEKAVSRVGAKYPPGRGV